MAVFARLQPCFLLESRGASVETVSGASLSKMRVNVLVKAKLCILEAERIRSEEFGVA